MPSFISVFGDQPKFRSTELSSNFLNEPFGLSASHLILPLNSTSDLIKSASAAMLSSKPLPTLIGVSGAVKPCSSRNNMASAKSSEKMNSRFGSPVPQRVMVFSLFSFAL